MASPEELFDLLARLVGTINEKDLIDDPELTAMVSQLVQVLSPKAPSLPSDLIEKLTAIENRIERFKTAADLIEASDPVRLKQLAESMKQTGLLKNEAGGRSDAAAVTPVEDLMKEHSSLRRLMAVYRKCLDRRDPDLGILKESARIIKSMVHDFHEKMEEEFIFPALKKRRILVDLVDVLDSQHRLVRPLTDTIIESDDSSKVLSAVSDFLDIYTAHGTREDTELFPVWRRTMSAGEYAMVGEKFRFREREQFGDSGFEFLMAEIAGLEKRIGVHMVEVRPSEDERKRFFDAGLITFSEQVEDGVKCSNCKHVDSKRSFCNHPRNLFSLKDKADRMCCDFYGSSGSVHHGEKDAA